MMATEKPKKAPSGPRDSTLKGTILCHHKPITIVFRFNIYHYTVLEELYPPSLLLVQNNNGYYHHYYEQLRF